MLPVKLKTFHDDLMDGVHTSERGGFCFFIFNTVWKVWSGHFLLSIHNHIGIAMSSSGSGPNFFSITLCACVTKFDFDFSSRLHALKVNIQPSMIDEDNANFWSAQSCVGPGSAQLSAKSEDTEFDGSFYLSVHGIYGENEIDSAAT